MKIGKVPEVVLKRSVLKQIKHRREEIIVRPGVGKDCAAIDVKDGEVIVLSTDPITGTTEDIGTLAVHITANDIASAGAKLIGIMLTILLPENARESDLREMMQEIDGVCHDLGIEVVGGHTEVTKAVNQPVITVTGVGKMKKEDILISSNVKPGQEIVMTKWAGLEGTAVISAAKEEELKVKFTSDFIQHGKGFLQYISVVKEAAIGKKVGVTFMHDITEGGVFGALWELAEASSAGLDIYLKRIPLKQETVEICEFYDLNPYMLISSGSMLMVTDKGNELVDALNTSGIPAAIIGRVTKGNDRVIINEEEKRFLEPPKSDELYKVM